MKSYYVIFFQYLNSQIHELKKGEINKVRKPDFIYLPLFQASIWSARTPHLKCTHTGLYWRRIWVARPTINDYFFFGIWIWKKIVSVNHMKWVLLASELFWLWIEKGSQKIWSGETTRKRLHKAVGLSLDLTVLYVYCNTALHVPHELHRHVFLLSRTESSLA